MGLIDAVRRLLRRRDDGGGAFAAELARRDARLDELEERAVALARLKAQGRRARAIPGGRRDYERDIPLGPA